MKNKRIYIVAAMATLTFAACSDNSTPNTIDPAVEQEWKDMGSQGQKIVCDMYENNIANVAMEDENVEDKVAIMERDCK